MSLTIIRSDQLAAFTTSLYFHSLHCLNVDPEIFLLNVNESLTPEHILEYTNSVAKLVLGISNKDEYCLYIRSILKMLRDWAEAGYSIEIKGV